jgi:shikimate kinase/3-dehydroquinate synthase
MIRISEPQPPVVVLAGFMGSGKSEVGRLLAQRLGVELIDTDALIESRAGMSVVELFERHGEERFREMEVELCRELCPRGGAVISTGGGMLMNRENFRRLSAMGTVVLLECDADAAVERLRGAGNRPLLAGVGDNDAARREWIEATLKRRRPVYERIPFKVDTTGSTSAETVEEIVARLDPGSRVIHVNVGVRPFPLSANGRGPVTDGECRVVVGRGAASRLGWYLDEMGLALRSFLFVPSQLESRLTARIKPSLEAASIAHEVVKVADGDANKNLAQVRDLLDHLAASGAGRDSVVVSVGGGVTGDVAGFVASTYMRGVPFVQVPTTLVSQVDASIGGKVGVNHPRAKNLIGSIYQPVLVLSDPLMLEGLPFEEISNGMAEVVKTALIGSPELYEFVAAAVDEPRERKLVDPAFLEYCAFESARVKCEIVERDPFERDVRRVLNLGHTVGHALESALAYEGLRHGEAVALGTIAAIRVSVARGFAAPGLLDRTFSILRWCGLPTHTPPVDRELLIRSLALDKKRKSGQLFFVLPVEVGRVEIVGDVTDDELLDALW